MATNGALLQDVATQNALWQRISSAMPDRRRSSGPLEDARNLQQKHATARVASASSIDAGIGNHGYQSYRTSLAQVCLPGISLFMFF